ncbi:MAG: peptidoglycan editing factor PgeF, partial [Burkholderiales bacterium]|nr:peptidoglycan editing factor PgeF [Burkholderiales bacterium]
ADACGSEAPGVACTVLVADCLPILLTDNGGSRVAALHAGWRGLAAGVIERTLEHWRALETNAGDASSLMAWLGPCIGPQAFEVGPEVRAAFMAVDVRADASFRPLEGGKYLADLPQLARQRLASQGVVRIHGNDGSRQWCTMAGAERFFSHRRSQRSEEATGRMAACIWRE